MEQRQLEPNSTLESYIRVFRRDPMYKNDTRSMFYVDGKEGTEITLDDYVCKHSKYTKMRSAYCETDRVSRNSKGR